MSVQAYYSDEQAGITLYCGDCREMLPALAPGSVDLVLTDPPYGKGYHEGGIAALPSDKWRTPGPSKWQGRRIHGDKMPDTSSLPILADLLRPGGALYLFSQWMVEQAWLAAVEDAGLTVRNRLIWVKSHWGAGDLATTYGPQHETVIFASKGRHELRGKRMGDIWIEKCPTGTFRSGRLHPNEKPLDLVRLLILRSSDVGALVLDPYAGSGTTLVAAKQLQRHAFGAEIHEPYAEIAARRLCQGVLPLEAFPCP